MDDAFHTLECALALALVVTISPDILANQFNAWTQGSEVRNTKIAHINHAHPMAAGKQLRQQNRPQITGAARDQDIHL